MFFNDEQIFEINAITKKTFFQSVSIEIDIVFFFNDLFCM